MEQAAQLKTILEGLLVPDNAARQAAEAALEQAQKTQPSPFLLALLTLCGDSVSYTHLTLPTKA